MKSCTLAPATAAGLNPPQFSLPHSPVANAHVTVLRLVGITFNNGVSAPVTAVLITLVFQFRLIVMSLYGLKMNPLAVPPPAPPPPVPPTRPPPPVSPAPPAGSRSRNRRPARSPAGRCRRRRYGSRDRRPGSTSS